MPFNNQNGVVYSRLIFYHFGKITTYAFLGLLTGLLGDALRFFFLQQWISIFAGVVLLSVYFLPKILTHYNTSSVSNLWNKHIVMRMRKLLQPNPQQSMSAKMFSIGLVNGLLPCGLVYMALLGAISQPSMAMSVLFMIVFGIGTSPALSAIILANQFILNRWKTAYQNISGALVVVVSALLILRGLGLGIPYISPASSHPDCCSAPHSTLRSPNINGCIAFHQSENQYFLLKIDVI
jgi:sulfite exporter TauE/SafE